MNNRESENIQDPDYRSRIIAAQEAFFKRQKEEILNNPKTSPAEKIAAFERLNSQVDYFKELASQPIKFKKVEESHPLGSKVKSFLIGAAAGGVIRWGGRAGLSLFGFSGLPLAVTVGGGSNLALEYGKQVFSNIKETTSRSDRLTRENSTFKERMGRAWGDFYHLNGKRLGVAFVTGAAGGAIGYGVTDFVSNHLFPQPSVKGAAEWEWFKQVAHDKFGDHAVIEVADKYGTIVPKEISFTDPSSFDPQDGYFRMAYEMALADRQGVGLNHDLWVNLFEGALRFYHPDVLNQSADNLTFLTDRANGEFQNLYYPRSWYIQRIMELITAGNSGPVDLPNLLTLDYAHLRALFDYLNTEVAAA